MKRRILSIFLVAGLVASVMAAAVSAVASHVEVPSDANYHSTATGSDAGASLVATHIVEGAKQAAAVAVPAPAQQIGCVEVPGYNDTCPAWATSYDSTAAGCSEDPAGQAVGGGAVYLAATRICGGQFDILVLAFGLDGALRWEEVYAGEAGRRDIAQGVAISPDGRRLYVAGSEDRGESVDWVTLALDTETGEQLWATNHDGPPGLDDEAWVPAVSEDGERIYVTGFDRVRKPDETAWPNTLTIAYEASTGEPVWMERFDGDPERQDFPRAIGVSGDRVVVTGSSLFPGQDLQTVVYRDDRELGRGEELWRASYDGGDWDQPIHPCLTSWRSFCGLMGSIAVTDDTAVVAATSFVDPTTDDAIWTTLAYDLETGERRWLQKLGDPELQSKANAIAASPDGRTTYVTGFTNDELLWDGVGDAAAVAYDTHSGQERWRTNYALPGVEDASGFGIAAGEDEVYVTGAVQLWPQMAFRVDVLTLAYDAEDGTQLWVARHNRESQPGGIGDHDGGNWPDLTADGTRLIIGGELARTFRPQDQRDLRDIGLLAYDVNTPGPDPTPTPTHTPTASSTPSPTESPMPEITEVVFTADSETSGQHTDETLFEARLTDSDGDPIPAQELTFELTGAESSRTFTATSDSDGVAAVTPTLEEKPGPYQLTVRFAGDEEHAADADTASFIVDKEDSALELSVHGEDDDKTLRARLSDLDTSSEGIAQRTIDFYSDGELIGSEETDADGVASVALPPRHRGNNRTYEAVFDGDDFYLGASDDRPGKGKGGDGSGGNGSRDASAGYGGKVLLM